MIRVASSETGQCCSENHLGKNERICKRSCKHISVVLVSPLSYGSTVQRFRMWLMRLVTWKIERSCANEMTELSMMIA